MDVNVLTVTVKNICAQSRLMAKRLRFLGGFLTDLEKRLRIWAVSSLIWRKGCAFGRLFSPKSKKISSKWKPESPKYAVFIRKTKWTSPKNATFCWSYRPKTQFSDATEIAAHFLRNERHYLVDVLGKTLKKACLQSFSRVFGGCFGERP